MGVRWYQPAPTNRSAVPTLAITREFIRVNGKACEAIGAPCLIRLGLDEERRRVILQETDAGDKLGFSVSAPKKNSVQLRGGKMLAVFLEKVPIGKYILRQSEDGVSWYIEYPDLEALRQP